MKLKQKKLYMLTSSNTVE